MGSAEIKPRRTSIAAAQTVPVRGDVPANTAEHLRLAQAAAEQGVRLLVFPEFSLTGYELDLADKLGFTEDDERLDPLLDAASSLGVAMVVGAPVRLASGLHIGAFALLPDRSIRIYTKQRLGAFSPNAAPDGIVPPAENTVFETGDRDPLIHVDGCDVAIAICADTGAPQHPERAAARGATTYAASMFFTPPELERESGRLGSYAARHAMTVALANFGGPSGGLAAAGGSAVWCKDGRLVARIDGPGRGLAVAIEGADGWRGQSLML